MAHTAVMEHAILTKTWAIAFKIVVGNLSRLLRLAVPPDFQLYRLIVPMDLQLHQPVVHNQLTPVEEGFLTLNLVAAPIVDQLSADAVVHAGRMAVRQINVNKI